jgi:alpha-glucosidase
MKPDNSAPEILSNGANDFTFAIVDLFKDKAREWYERVIQCNVMQLPCDNKTHIPLANDGDEPLVYGWMHDFAEGLPIDASVGNDADMGKKTAHHNAFTTLWQQTGSNSIKGFEDENSFFGRSGGLKAPGAGRLFWMGDQITAWDGCDGMQSALIGMMSAGASGWALTHSDIGGYTEVKGYIKAVLTERSGELLSRWFELSTFADAIMRTHPGLIPAMGAQAYDRDVLPHVAKFTKLHVALRDYKASLFDEAEKFGWPLVRHGWLHYPDAAEWFSPSEELPPFYAGCRAGYVVGLQQFLLGPDTSF